MAEGGGGVCSSIFDFLCSVGGDRAMVARDEESRSSSSAALQLSTTGMLGVLLLSGKPSASDWKGGERERDEINVTFVVVNKI